MTGSPLECGTFFVGKVFSTDCGWAAADRSGFKASHPLHTVAKATAEIEREIAFFVLMNMGYLKECFLVIAVIARPGDALSLKGWWKDRLVPAGRR